MVTGRSLAALAFNWSDSILLPSLGLIAVLLVGAGVILLIQRWRKQDDAASLSPTEQLAEYRLLYDRGVMSKHEFDSLRALLEGKTRADMKPTAAPVSDPRPEVIVPQPPAVQPAPPPATSDGLQPPPAPEAGNGQT
jgi:hypothetical protein